MRIFYHSCSCSCLQQLAGVLDVLPCKRIWRAQQPSRCNSYQQLISRPVSILHSLHLTNSAQLHALRLPGLIKYSCSCSHCNCQWGASPQISRSLVDLYRWFPSPSRPSPRLECSRLCVSSSYCFCCCLRACSTAPALETAAGTPLLPGGPQALSASSVPGGLALSVRCA